MICLERWFGVRGVWNSSYLFHAHVPYQEHHEGQNGEQTEDLSAAGALLHGLPSPLVHRRTLLRALEVWPAHGMDAFCFCFNFFRDRVSA